MPLLFTIVYLHEAAASFLSVLLISCYYREK
jgi:hypothetical protein